MSARGVVTTLVCIGVIVGLSTDYERDTTAGTPSPSVGTLKLSEVDVDFSDVRDLAVSDAGVWVLDAVEPFVTFVPADGTAPRQFGREGRGPSELLNPSGLDVEGADPANVRVWDVGNARVADFDGSGSLIEARPIHGTGLTGIRSDIRQITYVDPFRVRRVGSDYVVATYPGGVSRTSDFQTGTLVRVGPTLARKSPVLAFSSDAVHFAGPETSLEFTAVPLWDGCSEMLVTWVPERGTVRWIDVTGALVYEVPVELETPAVTLDDIESYLRWMARLELGPGFEDKVPDMRGVARSMRGQFALQAPAATEIRCGSDGSAWLRTFGTEASPLGLGRDWLRVDVDGHVSQWTLPEAFSPKAFTQHGAFGVVTDEVGLQHLARWTPEGAR